MPLLPGYSRPTISANISTLLKEGYSREEAAVIALSRARRDFSLHGSGPPPPYLKAKTKKRR